VTRRSPWIAAILAVFCGPVAFLYCGRSSRAFVWLAINLILGLLGYAYLQYVAASLPGVVIAGTVMATPQLALIVDAVRVARQGQTEFPKWYQRWWGYLIAIVAWFCWGTFLSWFLRVTWAEAFVMPTRSMRETILPGDRFLVDRFAIRVRDIRYGDIVAHQENGVSAPLYVRRVVGLQGDVIELKEEKLYRNGEAVEEPYAIHEGPIHEVAGMREFGPHTVAPSTVFLLGDNRRMSRDSRFDGDYPLSDIVGIARIVYWSREYSESPPVDPRKDRNPKIEWGSIRWPRIGQRLD
jgi:signal peptidase I